MGLYGQGTRTVRRQRWSRHDTIYAMTAPGLNHPLPGKVYRLLSDAPSGIGIVILRAEDETPMSAHIVKDAKAFLVWLFYGAKREYLYSYEKHDNLVDAVERCNEIVMLIVKVRNEVGLRTGGTR
jgi:hypothetical protein